MKFDSGIPLDIYITVNSPGEIAGWAVPVVRELRPRVRDCRVTLMILPCQYASGEEMELCKAAGADRIVRVGDIGRLSVSRGKRLVLRLGGDFFFSVYLSRRLKCPLWAYSSQPRWARFVDMFFVPDDKSARKFAALGFHSKGKKKKYEKIGHIALDSVPLSENEDETRGLLGLTDDEPVVSFLTGSRPIEYCQGAPFFTRVASMVTEKFPDHRAIFPLADSVREDLLRASLNDAGIDFYGELLVREIDIGGGRRAKVVRGKTPEIIGISRLAIAAPGTNNLQAAALYTPYIMVLPLDKADEFPLDGLPGLLPLNVPGVRRFKKWFINRLSERTPLLSPPNKMAGKMIAPELRGDVKPEDAAFEAIRLLCSPDSLQEISRAFWELTNERGAAAKLTARIAEWV
ncbi:hypothetical protein FACS1894216_22150 [Synergistales bacterium]|nr:hypothetical protein FACS1894216_22150 [Synergistales bacterium]